MLTPNDHKCIMKNILCCSCLSRVQVKILYHKLNITDLFLSWVFALGAAKG